MKQETSTSNYSDKSVDLSGYNNDWYRRQIGAGRLKRLCWYLVNSTIFFHPLFAWNGLKVSLLRWFGARIGRRVVIKPSVNIKYPWKLSIDDNCWIGEHVWIDNLADVTIGKNVCVSQGAYLLTGNHDYKSIHFNLVVRPIVLQDGVWIGAKSVVAPGTIAASHAVLSVGSVATQDMLPHTIYQGNPASAVRERNLSDQS